MRKAFPYLYSIFILSQFMIGQLYLPGLPLNILQISTILMLALCFMLDRKIPRDRYIVLYFLFLFFYFLSSVFTGYTDTLFDNVLPQMLISFTIFWATKILVQRYDTLLPLVIPASVAGVVDSVVTIFQAIGKPILSPLVVILMQNPEAMDIASDGTLGVSISGLFMNPVFNGHALLFCFVCSLFGLQGRYKLARLVFPIIIFAGLFFCQQRSAFYLSVLTILIVGWRIMQSNPKIKVLIVVLSLLVAFYLFPHVEAFILESGSRIMDVSMTGREEIWQAASNFLSDHILIGGFDKFVHQYGRFPHNLFLSAYLAGGLIGGTILMLLISMLLFSAIKSYFRNQKQNISLLVSACLISVLIADSLTHNTGLVEADFSTFLAMSLCYYYNDNNPYKLFRTI